MTGVALDHVAAEQLRQQLQAAAPFAGKTRVPSTRPGTVERPALLERLAEGAPVVVVSAPAGYGKTTLLAQWASVDPRPFAWLTVTGGDHDVAVVAAYLAAALDAAEPLEPQELAVLGHLGADGPTVVLPRLGRVLLQRPRPYVLVLDDAHVLGDATAEIVLGLLVAHVPEGSQVVIATRHEPPLPRARLRAQRLLLELDAHDLALDAAQGAAVLRAAGLELEPDHADALVERTEGWAAGLYLAALAARDSTADDLVARFTGDHRLVAEYLRDELLDALPDDTVEFLTRSSLLEYLDGPACDEVLQRSDSRAVLAELAGSNLFVAPIDDAAEQYRYHHLFADLLQLELRRREPERIAQLHARASVVFEQRFQLNPAISHAYAAGELERAAGLVWVYGPAYLGSGRASTVRRWLELFSPGEIADQPELAVAAAWVAITDRKPEAVSPWVELARRHDPSRILAGGSPVGAIVSLLDATVAARGVAAMLDGAREACHLDVETSPFRGMARLLEGIGHRLQGDDDGAQPILEQAIALARHVTPGSAATGLAQLALIEAGRGSWPAAELLVEQAESLVAQRQMEEQPLQTLAFAVAALVHAHQGRPERARRAVSQSRRLLALIRHVADWLLVETRLVLAYTELDLGDRAAARLLAAEAAEVLAHALDPGVLPRRLEDLELAIASDGRVAAALGVAPLTTAELRVLAYLPTHLSFQAMAVELFVSRNTVKTQAISIYRKLQVSSRADAVARARELGLLDP
jgi:LuxR family maltose regulon positive regulatory protein